MKVLTREKLMGASVRETLHENRGTNADGECRKWRVNGVAKEWKTRPEEFRVPIKYGLRVCGEITEANVGGFHLESECPWVRFKELGHGEQFEFRSTYDYALERGPWRRVGQRMYVREEDFKAGWRGLRYKVGSINTWVRRVCDEDDDKA